VIAASTSASSWATASPRSSSARSARECSCLAGAEADGLLLNYLPASHVSRCVEQVRRGGSATVYATIHVGVGDRVAAAPRARYDLFSYAVVDAYAKVCS
jgi:hypothetical protein